MNERPASPTAEHEEVPTGKRKRTKKTPLWYRIIYEEWMVALVRLLGHEGVPFKELREKAQPLVEKFGRERLQESADEITEIVGDGDAAVVRLTEEAHKLAIQLLGSPRTAKPVALAGSNAASPPVTDDDQSEIDRPMAQANSVTTLTKSDPSLTVDGSALSPSGVQEPITEPSSPPASHEFEPSAQDWANYETACVAAFLNGDCEFLAECLHLVDLCREQLSHGKSATTEDGTASDAQRRVLAEQLQRLVREYNPLADDDSVFAKLLDTALGNVDWHDLADSFLKRSSEKAAED